MFAYKKVFPVFPLLFLLVSSMAWSQAYIGINYASLSYEQLGVETAGLGPSNPPFNIISQEGGGERASPFRDLNVELQTASVKYGYSIFSWLSMEVRAGFGTSKKLLRDYAEKPRTRNVQIPNCDVNGNNCIDDTLRNAATGELDPIGGVKKTNINVTLTETKRRNAELLNKYYYGAYVRLGGNFRKAIVSPYLLFGYTRGSFEVAATSGTGGGHVNSNSYGIGANIKIMDQLFVNMEYLDLFSSSNINVSKSWGLGLEYRL